MPTYDRADRSAFVALGAIFGMAIGVGAGMLMAPRSGEETRRELRDRAMTARQKARTQLATTRDKAADKLSHTLDRSKDMIDKAAEKAKDTVDKTADRAKSAAAQAQAETAARRRATS